MMNVVRPRHTFSNRGLLYPERRDVPHHSATNLIPTDGNALAKKQIFRPISSKGRHTKEWTTIAWPTNIQSRKPDGKFGPAQQMQGWSDCWFLAALAAVANDKEGQQILAESIKKVRIEGLEGYHVTFAGSPNNQVFISDQELDNCLDTNGGDADTRLLELAANKFFSAKGNFKFIYFAALIKAELNQEQAEECLQRYCGNNDIQDPMNFNPMHDGGHDALAFFMFTGINPDLLTADSPGSTNLQKSDMMTYLNRYATNDRDGASIVINGTENPLGDTPFAKNLAIEWDVVRTDITRDGRFRKQQRAFLNALNRWLGTPDHNTRQALQSAAENLYLEHINPVTFLKLLDLDRISLRQNHRDLLRSGVQEVLAGGPGYIGFPGDHCATIEGINEAVNTFTYSEPNFPTVVHTGELSNLVQAIANGNVWLSALEPTTGQDEAESSHAGEKRARHLREIHHQAVRDGKIDPAESGPLANLMEMDAGAFRQVYDSDKNGAIEGGELKAVQLRVDRQVDHFTLTPTW